MSESQLVAFMTPKEVSELLRVKRTTLHEWAKKYCMPHYRVGHSIRFKRDDVLKWCEEKKVGKRVENFR